MFLLKKGHQPGVYVPLRALFLVFTYHCFFLIQILLDENKKARSTVPPIFQTPLLPYLKKVRFHIATIFTKRYCHQNIMQVVMQTVIRLLI